MIQNNTVVSPNTYVVLTNSSDSPSVCCSCRTVVLFKDDQILSLITRIRQRKLSSLAIVSLEIDTASKLNTSDVVDKFSNGTAKSKREEEEQEGGQEAVSYTHLL